LERNMQRSLAIIKPDAVANGSMGKILARIEEEGLKIVALKMVFMSKKEAQGFYHVHREKPFFDSLTDFMSSGPCVPLVLEGENAIDRWREVMGATNPVDAAPGTLRALFATDVEKNAVHGSDSPRSASTEIPYFFSSLECRPA
jgi:nucleoside-diphosphate kinase